MMAPSSSAALTTEHLKQPLKIEKTATIYIQNLNEKVKLADLKNSLF